MRKLSKLQTKQRDDIVNTLEALNADLSKAFDQFTSVVERYNEALGDAREWRDDMVSIMDDYISERSEAWSESDNGSDYESWKGEYENLDLEDLELPAGYEDLSHRDDLDNLPESPG